MRILAPLILIGTLAVASAMTGRPGIALSLTALNIGIGILFMATTRRAQSGVAVTFERLLDESTDAPTQTTRKEEDRHA